MLPNAIKCYGMVYNAIKCYKNITCYAVSGLASVARKAPAGRPGCSPRPCNHTLS